MKETPKRYTNPFLSDEENENVILWNQELEHSNIEDDLTNTCQDDKLINSLTPSELYTDKNVMESELPESLLCSKEGAFHVKDICVDEGIPHGERILFDENDNEMLKPDRLRFSTMEDYYMESNPCSEINAKIATGFIVLGPSNDHMNIGDNHDEVIETKHDASSGTHEVDTDLPVNEPVNDNGTGSISIETQIPVQVLQNSLPDSKECRTHQEVIDSIFPNELKEMPKPDRLMFASQSDTVSKAVDNNGTDISLQPCEEQINSSAVSSLQQD